MNACSLWLLLGNIGLLVEDSRGNRLPAWSDSQRISSRLARSGARFGRKSPPGPKTLAQLPAGSKNAPLEMSGLRSMRGREGERPTTRAAQPQPGHSMRTSCVARARCLMIPAAHIRRRRASLCREEPEGLRRKREGVSEQPLRVNGPGHARPAPRLWRSPLARAGPMRSRGEGHHLSKVLSQPTFPGTGAGPRARASPSSRSRHGTRAAAGCGAVPAWRRSHR